MKRNRYFSFLCDIVDPDGLGEYDRLLWELQGIKFYSFVPNDDNRAEDGKQLRDKFVDKEGQHALSLCQIGECTVLEMLIGLSYRLEFESLDSSWEKTPDQWFWILLDNLGMTSYHDDTLSQLRNVDDVRRKVNVLLERGYKRNGAGGLFPLQNPRRDQRRVEIWYQMTDYIIENYPF